MKEGNIASRDHAPSTCAATPKSAATEAEPSGRLGAFAVGNYECICATCGTHYEGDKRSVSCLSCALKARPLAGSISEFAWLIRYWRESQGLSLSEAARRAGITKAHLHDMEAGRSRNPCVSTLVGLARALDGSVSYMAHLAARGLPQGPLADSDKSREEP